MELFLVRSVKVFTVDVDAVWGRKDNVSGPGSFSWWNGLR
jgi:hypothetical protein